ncbi:MAG: DUF192 domain-containing protein [Candidatus Parvarchaeota archaeon]|nr:DUF192 domain-containing protein [Candidatus Parvarchaeota archaeon]
MEFCDVYKGAKPIAKRVKYCGTFGLKLLGLMFVKHPGAGAFLPDVKDIHMNFVNFELRVVWLDRDFRVMEEKIAKRWRLYNGPYGAVHVLELPVSNHAKLSVGDKLKIKVYENKNSNKHDKR